MHSRKRVRGRTLRKIEELFRFVSVGGKNRAEFNKRRGMIQGNFEETSTFGTASRRADPLVRRVLVWLLSQG